MIGLKVQSLSKAFSSACFCFALLWSVDGEQALSQTQTESAKQNAASAETDSAKERVKGTQLSHLMAQSTPGLIIPLYQYPANIHTNPAFNRVMELKREYPTIPFWVILNPATGPGKSVDANYTKAVDRLVGAGCIVLGYVSTEYGNRSTKLVDEDLIQWRVMYPRVHGIFFDEMVYKDEEPALKHQLQLSQLATSKGYWPIVTNPGADTPERFFKTPVADVIIVHESAQWPMEDRIHGNYFGGYSDYPPHSRGVLVHSMKTLAPDQVKMVGKYAKWIYVTQDEYRLNDATAPNPWDELSVHLESLCKLLSQ